MAIRPKIRTALGKKENALKNGDSIPNSYCYKEKIENALKNADSAQNPYCCRENLKTPCKMATLFKIRTAI